VSDNATNEQRIRASFAKQGHMTAIGATIGPISRGSVEIALQPSPVTSQQHGFVHGGIVSALADTAAGYSALSVMPPGTGVLTVEFKINFVSPAIGDRIIARGRVLKPGRTLVLTQADVFAETAGKEKLIAVLLGTMMAVEDRDGVSD
jgi:uncharacterized protein (TIGR00369 family)